MHQINCRWWHASSRTLPCLPLLDTPSLLLRLPVHGQLWLCVWHCLIVLLRVCRCSRPWGRLLQRLICSLGIWSICCRQPSLSYAAVLGRQLSRQHVPRQHLLGQPAVLTASRRYQHAMPLWLP